MARTLNPEPRTLNPARWPRLWRLIVIGLGVLILCSCRGPAMPANTPAMSGGAYATLPPEAFTGVPAAAQPCPPVGPPGMELGVPLPYCPTSEWRPPGIAGPWPPDEYICDGGDAGLPIRVGNQWEVRGLKMEDAVAHYDTMDGRTVVEPTNRVCLYAPRFGAVRQVINPRTNQQQDRAAGVFLPTKLAAPRTSEVVNVGQQNVQAEGEIALRPAEIIRTKQGRGVVSSRLGPREFQNGYLPHENFTVIRTGTYVESEMAFLAKGVNAAVAWTSKQAVQIILERRAAMAEIGGQKPETVYTVELPGRPRLRVIKVASTPFAEPGDEVSFTIRFDNVGNQPIGNVTIVDSLNTRLEYIPDSAQCSVDAKFSTAPNEGDSVVVRCEITDPLRPGKGGVLRFRCRVR